MDSAVPTGTFVSLQTQEIMVKFIFGHQYMNRTGYSRTLFAVISVVFYANKAQLPHCFITENLQNISGSMQTAYVLI